MRIERDGKAYELTFQEMLDAVHEVIAIEKRWEEEADAQKTEKNAGKRSEEKAAEWKAFVSEKCKDLPYPHNLIVESIYEGDVPEAQAFLSASAESQSVMANRVANIVEKLQNEKQRAALLYWYRDGMKVGEIAKRLGCGNAHVYNLKYLGARAVCHKLRYEEFAASRKAIVEADPQEIELSQVLCLSVRTKHYLGLKGVKTLGQLLAMSREEVLAIPGMGFRFGSRQDTMRELETCAEFYSMDAAYAKKEQVTAEQVLLYVLPLHIYYALEKGGIDNIDKLLNSSKGKLLQIKGIGEATVQEIARILKRKGYDIAFLVGKEEKITKESPVDSLMLTGRARNCLLKAGIRTVGDILNKTKAELENIPGMGIMTMYEVIRVTQSAGFDVSHLRYTKE